MISIIICSVNKIALDKVAENIANTIGVAFEIIAIDNSLVTSGICAAYNKGAAKAKYDTYCFMHEDIAFETYGWGGKVLAHLSKPCVGLIGMAGGTIKSWVPSSWASLIYTSEINYIQHFKGPGLLPEKITRTHSPKDSVGIKNVVCVDGFWMCTRRDVFAKFTFDEKAFPGFHGYDIDYSLQVGSQYHVAVIFDILLHHFSEGSFNATWMKNAMVISDKWKSQLPRSIENLSKEILLRQHWTSMNVFIDKLIALNYSFPYIYKSYFKYAFSKYFNSKHFLYFLRHISLAYFKKKRSTLL